jgi:predicted aspartyl protease
VPAYDSGFNPPAPIADVTVFHPTTGAQSTLRGKMDTGADISVLPESVVVQLGIGPKGHVWTRGFDGSYSRRPLYYVRLTVEGFNAPMVRCVATQRTNILLGRNVLNRFVILLDGKNQIFDIGDP